MQRGLCTMRGQSTDERRSFSIVCAVCETHTVIPPRLRRIILSENGIHIIGTISVLIGVAYLGWFIFIALDFDIWWLAVPLMLANIQGYVVFVCFLFSAWNNKPLEIPCNDFDGTVDVFLPSLDESFEVLAPAIAAAVAIRHPHETYVLDDGSRDWVRDLCEELGARWITREDNRHAKAGNINHGLTVSNGEFIVTLDADFIASRTMVDDLIAYFADPNVALVQAPQVFYNRDSFQHPDENSDWSDQSFFHDVVMPSTDHRNAAFWCGSPAIVRRAALEAVGGVATFALTEDIATTVLLHRRGWRTRFDRRVVARGIAPETYERFLKQRLRWTIGGAQMLVGQYWRSGFKLNQRLGYIALTGAVFSALRSLVMYCLMPAMVLTGTTPVHYSLLGHLAIWAMPVAVIGSSLAFGRSSYRFLRTEVFGVITMYAGLAAFPALFGASPRFQVTKKGRVSTTSAMRGPLALLAFLLLINLASVTYGTAWITGLISLPDMPTLLIGTWAWTAVMSIAHAYCLRYALHHGNRAWGGLHGDWPAIVTSNGHRVDATVTRLAVGRLRFVTATPMPSTGDVAIELPSLGFVLQGEIERTEKTLDGQTTWIELQTQSLPLARWVGKQIFPDTQVAVPAG